MPSCSGPRRRALTLLFALSACSPPPRAPASVSSPWQPTTAPAAEPARAPEPHEGAPSLVITLTPVSAESRVGVEVVATGPADTLRRWRIESPGPDSLRAIEARDASGVLPHRFEPSASGPGLLDLDVREGPVRLVYQVESRPRPPYRPVGVAITPDTFEASGESLLLLPVSMTDVVVPVVIRFSLDSLHPHGGAKGASSFGVGDHRSTRASAKELSSGTFLAGALGRAWFDAAEGRDEAAWMGYTAFDPRPIAADVAAFRTAVAQRFGPPSTVDATLLFATDARPRGTFRVRRRTRGVVVHTAASEPWSAPLRIAVAAAALHDWIGGRLWIGPTDPRDEGRAYWFSEGINRHFARDLLFRFGLISPDEMLDEIRGLTTTALASPSAGASNDELGGRIRDPGALAVVVARGALYGARLEALVRARSGGKRTLAHVVRELMDRARATGGALGLDAWLETIEREVGTGEKEVFERMVMAGGKVELPAGALGPCFVPIRQPYVSFDLGFDADASLFTRVVTRSRPGGPADRAGLREGDAVVRSKVAWGDPTEPVEIEVERDGKREVVRYLPVGGRANGPGWRRRPGVGDERCAGE